MAEYSNYEQLKRMRQAYIVHVLDQVLSERSIVTWNDKLIREEDEDEEEREHGPKVTLDNVFELAAKDASDQDEESDNEGGSEDEEVRAKALLEAERIDDAEMVKATDWEVYRTGECRQD